MKRKILIIGGMGPQASLLLHQRIIARAIDNGAQKAEQFPEILHCSIPFPDFISDPKIRFEALNTLKQSLYRLWPASNNTRRYSLQYSTPLV